MRIKDEKSAKAIFYETAMELFLEQGVNGTTFDQVIEKAGYKSRSSIYAYFRNKEEIFEDLVFAILHDFVDCVEELEGASLSPSEKVTALVQHFILTKCDSPKQTELTIDHWRFLKGERQKEFVAKRQIIIDSIHKMLEEGKETGEFQFMNLEIATRIILHSIRLVNDKAVNRLPNVNKIELVKSITEMVLKAIRTPALAVLQKVERE